MENGFPPSVNQIAELIRRATSIRPSSDSVILKEAKNIQKKWGKFKNLTDFSYLPRSKTPVINGTGIILHTGLGRAPLGDTVVQKIAKLMKGYVDLEIDLETGKRGARSNYLDSLFESMNGSYKSVWVNNCASAILLTLSTLRKTGKYQSLILSRGEMVEIGGGFRVPEIMAESGFSIREIGTTNRTKFKDFENALKTFGPAVVCRVHPSNFIMEGFTENVPPIDLIELCNKYKAPLIYDAGTLTGDEIRKIPKGFDCVTLSTDKTLGGPQGGLIMASVKWRDLLLQNPLYRAFRLGKLSLVALESVIEAHAEREDRKYLPVASMQFLDQEELKQRATSLVTRVSFRNFKLSVVTCEASLGGGSTSNRHIPSKGIKIEPLQKLKNFAETVLKTLRSGDPALLISIFESYPIINLTTVLPTQDPDVKAALIKLDHSLS